MDGGDWWAAVHGVTQSWTRLGDQLFPFHLLHICIHTLGLGCRVLAPSRGKARPPCSAPRETAPGPLFLSGQEAASPQTRPSSHPSEPDSVGALSSAGLCGLAWPGLGQLGPWPASKVTGIGGRLGLMET